MEISELIPHIEALVFASDKPLSAAEITELINAAFGFMEEKVLVEQVDAAIEGIVEKYDSEFYPFEVRQSGGGWQFLTKKEYHKTVAQLNGEKFLKRLSSAALETLAIVAYKQPVTKGEIEAIRGVSTDYAMQKLLEKELVVITGRNEKLPGHPLVYATSKSFMDYFGINSADDLPKIKEVLAEQLIQPTVVNADVEPVEGLAVRDDGALVPADATAYQDVSGAEENISATLEEATNEPVGDSSETIEDEAVMEDAVTDEIFAAEDEAIEEMEAADTNPAQEEATGNPVPDEGKRDEEAPLQP